MIEDIPRLRGHLGAFLFSGDDVQEEGQRSVGWRKIAPRPGEAVASPRELPGARRADESPRPDIPRSPGRRPRRLRRHASADFPRSRVLERSGELASSKSITGSCGNIPGTLRRLPPQEDDLHAARACSDEARTAAGSRPASSSAASRATQQAGANCRAGTRQRAHATSQTGDEAIGRCRGRDSRGANSVSKKSRGASETPISIGIPTRLAKSKPSVTRLRAASTNSTENGSDWPPRSKPVSRMWVDGRCVDRFCDRPPAARSVGAGRRGRRECRVSGFARRPLFTGAKPRRGSKPQWRLTCC